MKPRKLKHDVPVLLKRLDDAGVEVTDAFSFRRDCQRSTMVYLIVPKFNPATRSAVYSVVYDFVKDTPGTKVSGSLISLSEVVDDLVKAGRHRGRDVLGVKLRRLYSYEFCSLRFFRLKEVVA